MQFSRRDILKVIGLSTAGVVVPPINRFQTIHLELASFCIAGFAYHQGPSIRQHLNLSTPVKLISEPGNMHDQNAVRIEAKGKMLGYVPRKLNLTISHLLKQHAHLHAEIINLQKDGPMWEAVTVRVSIKTAMS